MKSVAVEFKNMLLGQSHIIEKMHFFSCNHVGENFINTVANVFAGVINKM